MIAARRARALAAMTDAGADALILGREANARYVSGARRLWLANARAFAPGCVLVGATGDVVFPTVTTDRVLAKGDVIWVDTGVTLAGYDSDFGRTWIVGASPTAAQRDQFRRWKDVIDAVLAIVKPGITGGDLTRAAIAAAGGTHRPWLPHLYLAHGIGVDSAEAPFIGTDLGADFDESIVLTPGMVFVLEPIAWTDGTGGYRSEEIVAVTENGYDLLSDFHYEPYAS